MVRSLRTGPAIGRIGPLLLDAPETAEHFRGVTWCLLGALALLALLGLRYPLKMLPLLCTDDQRGMFRRFARHAKLGAPLMFTSGPAEGDPDSRLRSLQVTPGMLDRFYQLETRTDPMRRLGHTLVLLGIAVIAACASRTVEVRGPKDISCNAPLKPHLRVDLYTDRSNRNAPSGRLTDDEWKQFVEEVLVKQFPDGGTVLENSGWWRRPNGPTFHGLGRSLVILIPLNEVQPDRSAVRTVISEIKTRYGPSSVGWEEDWVCAAF